MDRNEGKREGVAVAVVVRVEQDEVEEDMGEDETRERATLVDFIALDDD